MLCLHHVVLADNSSSITWDKKQIECDHYGFKMNEYLLCWLQESGSDH